MSGREEAAFVVEGSIVDKVAGGMGAARGAMVSFSVAVPPFAFDSPSADREEDEEGREMFSETPEKLRVSSNTTFVLLFKQRALDSLLSAWITGLLDA